jgi:hypothetical protein
MAVMKNTKKGIKMKLTKRQKDGIKMLAEQANTDPKKQALVAARMEDILTGKNPTKQASLEKLHERLEEALYEYLLATDGRHGRIIHAGKIRVVNLNKVEFTKYDATIGIDLE